MADQSITPPLLYRVCLQVGKTAPGAPLLHLQLLVNPVTGHVSGQGSQTQAVQGPASNIPIVDITGIIHGAGFGPITRLVSLKGHAFRSLPPPEIGEVQVPFHASLAVDNAWNGHGGWTLGATKIDNVPVKKVDCPADPPQQ